MSDETRRLKDEEQANWEFEFEAENTDVLKASEKQSGEFITDDSTDYKPFMKSALGVLLFGGIFLFMASNGVNFGAIGRFWWMIFLIPMFTGNRNPNWMGLTFLFLLVSGAFSGAIWGMWWLIFLIPMFMGKRSRSC